MSVITRLKQLENARPKPFVDGQGDDLVWAIVGDDRFDDAKKACWSPKTGWDLAAALDYIPDDIWDDPEVQEQIERRKEFFGKEITE